MDKMRIAIDTEVVAAGISKKGNNKWTGKQSVTINGTQYLVLITVVADNRYTPPAPQVQPVNSFTREQLEQLLQLMPAKK